MQVNPVRVVFSLSIWLLLMVAIAGYYFWSWLRTPIEVKPEHSVYVIDKGRSLYFVANELTAKGLIRWPRFWVFYARLSDFADIKAGEYRLAQKESPLSLLSRFQSGDVIEYQITLVEGLRFNDFLQTMHNHESLLNKLGDSTQDQILEILDLNIQHPEGWFFPDTYHFTKGDTDIALLNQAHHTMVEVLQQEWERRAEDLPYNSSYEALIMASIVEKETGVAYEREQIAGVFVRRLKQNMRLQTDPTVIYGLGSGYTGNLRRKDLETLTPYNTYLIRGLPPTPIAMPGLEAIRAALHPDLGDALYFVAKGDGTHQFSNTIEEHIAAVNKYQKNRRKDYRSAPVAKKELTVQPTTQTQIESLNSDTGK